MAGGAYTASFVDVIARLGACDTPPVGDRFHAFDLEADMMDAAPVFPALHAGHRVVLEVQDGQIDVAVGEIVAAGARAVDLADLLHPEHFDVELRRLVHVLGRDRDVLDLGHAVLPRQILARSGMTSLTKRSMAAVAWASVMLPNMSRQTR